MILYYGTEANNIDSIVCDGIHPRGRVALALTKNEAAWGALLRTKSKEVAAIPVEITEAEYKAMTKNKGVSSCIFSWSGSFEADRINRSEIKRYIFC